MNGFAMEMNLFRSIMSRNYFAPATKVREIEGWELVKLMREVDEQERAEFGCPSPRNNTHMEA